MLSKEKKELLEKINKNCDFADLAIIAQAIGCDLDTGLRSIVLDIIIAEPAKAIRKAYKDLW